MRKSKLFVSAERTSSWRIGSLNISHQARSPREFVPKGIASSAPRNSAGALASGALKFGPTAQPPARSKDVKHSNSHSFMGVEGREPRAAAGSSSEGGSGAPPHKNSPG